jgi:hypothetical protein
MLYNHITELIGNTPLLKIDPKVHGLKNFEIYAMENSLNLFNFHDQINNFKNVNKKMQTKIIRINFFNYLISFKQTLQAI